MLDLPAKDGISCVKSLTYTATGAHQIGATQAAASAAISIATPDATSVTFAATDVADNQEQTRTETVMAGQGYACAASGGVANLRASRQVTMAQRNDLFVPVVDAREVIEPNARDLVSRLRRLSRTRLVVRAPRARR